MPFISLTLGDLDTVLGLVVERGGSLGDKLVTLDTEVKDLLAGLDLGNELLKDGVKSLASGRVLGDPGKVSKLARDRRAHSSCSQSSHVVGEALLLLGLLGLGLGLLKVDSGGGHVVWYKRAFEQRTQTCSCDVRERT